MASLYDYCTGLLTRLVKINSINPGLAPGGAGEAEIIACCASELQRIGLQIQLVEGHPGRPSLIATLPGSGEGRSLMLNAHIDTVGIAEMSDPFAAELREGRLYGRGAYDMKGAAVACIAAARLLAESGRQLAGNLVVTLVADEEFESFGISEVLEQVRTDAAIVTEPTQLDICLAHKGFEWIEVQTHGRAAHGSAYDKGIDANMHMGYLLAELAELERQLRSGYAHPLLGPASLHAAMLQGGSGWSTYADSCRLRIERRTLPGETSDQTLAEIQELIAGLGKRIPNFKAEARVICSRAPFEVSRDAAIVQQLAKVLETQLQRPAAFIGDHPWMDSALLAAAGIETVVIGPAGDGAHAAVEWVDLQSVNQLAKILAETARQYCK